MPLFSKDEQEKMNIFLSNFTEVYLEDFTDKVHNEQLIGFGVLHSYFNNYDFT